MVGSSVDVTSRVVDFPAAPLRVLGPPGSGKTRLLIERYRALRAKGFDVHILTYTKDSYRRLTEAILEKNSVEFGYDPVVQYPRLASEIIALSGEKRPSLISAAEEQLLLEGLIVEHRSSIKSSFRSICRTDRFIRDVLDVFRALLQNGIGSGDAAKFAEREDAGAAIEDVLMLYGEFRKFLSARNLTTHSAISWNAARLCDGSRPDHPIAKANVLLVEDFQDIDRGQFELLTRIAPPGGAVAVNVFGDPLGSVFGHRGTEERFLFDDFPRLYRAETIHVPARCRDADAVGPAMEALLRETIGPDAGAYLPMRQDDIDGLAPAEPAVDGQIENAFSLEIVGDELDEAYTIAARIENLLLSGQCEPTDIAVITNEKNRYAHVLKAAFREHGIPLDTGGAATGVVDSFIYALLLLFDAPDDDVAVRSIITSPLYSHLRAEVLDDGSAASPDDDSSDDRALLRDFMVGLSATVRSRDARDWMPVIVEKCLRPVCESACDESNDDAAFAVVNRVLESWAGYAAALDKIGRAPDFRTFVGLSGLFTSRTSAPRLLPGTVGLYSCREAKGLYFPVVFIVGCSDLLFPAVSDRQSLIPAGRLEELIERTIPDRKVSIYSARTATKVLREQNHFLYIGLTRSTRALHLTAPRNFGGNEYPAPCAVLDKAVAGPNRHSTPENDRIPAPVLFARDWTAGGCEDELADPLAALSPAGAAWRLKRAQGSPISAERKPLSKSTLEMFLACPRQFYYRKLLEIPQESTVAARLGKLFHGVMERLGRRFRTKTALHAAVNTDVIRQLVDDVIDEDGTVEPSSFMDRSIRHYLEQMIDGILELDASLGDDYKISGVEESIPFEFNDVEFTGFVDRIENHAEGRTFIVDFKTGAIAKMGSTHRKYVLKAFDDPRKADWQIPFYLWAIRMREGRLPDAFRFMAVKAGEGPRAITLHACPNEDAVPDSARNKRGPESYLLEAEIHDVMELAAKKAKEIYLPREFFDRAVDEEPCQWCEFAELCQREKKWS